MTSESVAEGCMGFMNAALGPRLLAVFFFAVFFAGMHLSFRERPADPGSSAPGEITSTDKAEGQSFIGEIARPGAQLRGSRKAKKMERKTGFEPATATLARWSSTGLSYFRSRLGLSDRTRE